MHFQVYVGAYVCACVRLCVFVFRHVPSLGKSLFYVAVTFFQTVILPKINLGKNIQYAVRVIKVKDQKAMPQLVLWRATQHK